MRGKFTVIVAMASLAIWYGTSTRQGTVSAAQAPMDMSNMDMSRMTASEHIAHMAAMGNIHAGHAMMDMAAPAIQAAPANLNLPADEQGAAARLAASPRRGQYVAINPGLNAWVVQPQGGGQHPVVIVIQEIFGLSDWIRGVADQLASEGFIAVAPDLLSGHGPNGGDTRTFADQMAMTQATLMLAPAEIMDKLNAARVYALKLPNASGKSGVVGFCFGGNQSFALAVNQPGVNASVVYYGTAPTDVQAPARAGGPGPGGPGGPGAAPAGPGAGGPGGGRGQGGGPQAPFVPSDRIAALTAPVLGLYGGLMQDARIGSTVPVTEAKMKELGKTYEPHLFDGAGHGFLRAQTGNDGANMKATQTAWPLTVAWLKKYTS